MPEPFIKSYTPQPYVPTTALTGGEQPLTLRGEGMWLRIGRWGSIYAEGYAGNQDLSETIATKTLTGTFAWTSSDTNIVGTGTAFITELHLGSFVFADGGAGATELFVVEKIVSNTSFICSRPAKNSGTGKTAYVLPVIWAVETDRGTAIRGNVLRYFKGHYLGVGDGTFRVNGAALNATLTLSKTPQFALYDKATGLFTQDDVGIDKPTTPITLTAVTRLTITGATAASPISITSAAHGLATGTKVPIAGIIGVPEANGTFIITNTGVNTFTLNGTTGTGAYVSGGFVFPSVMRAGDYNIRIANKSTTTKGFSQLSDVIAPVTLTVNQSIRVTFNTAMLMDQDADDIYATPFEDNSTTTIEARFMGPWYLLNGTDTSPDCTVTASDLIDGSHATGRETGTSYVFSYSDAEIQTSTKIATFDNFTPVDAEFVDLINGFPIYFSCQGKNEASKTSTSPGPAAVPSKPSNPEAVFLDKTITTAGGDTIIGEFNAKSRIYVLGQNTLQTLILTTVDIEPITFRSLWNAGFRNPYNVTFVKEYLYGFSTQNIVRSVAGGDDSAMEFEFAADVRDLVNTWPTGHVLVAYDPKNRAVCFFYAAAERRSGYWVTIVLPFLLDKQVWSLPIVLKKTNQDFIVSGVATIGRDLTFLAGGRTSGGAITVGTYIFDGGDSETKDWYMAPNYSDDDAELSPKTIKGHSFTGRFASADTKLQLHAVRPEGSFNLTALESGISPAQEVAIGATSGIQRKRFKTEDWGSFSLYTPRISGSYTTVPDRLDELVLKVTVNNTEN